jgi:hypothetical protein
MYHTTVFNYLISFLKRLNDISSRFGFRGLVTTTFFKLIVSNKIYWVHIIQLKYINLLYLRQLAFDGEGTSTLRLMVALVAQCILNAKIKYSDYNSVALYQLRLYFCNDSKHSYSFLQVLRTLELVFEEFLAEWEWGIKEKDNKNTPHSFFLLLKKKKARLWAKDNFLSVFRKVFFNHKTRALCYCNFSSYVNTISLALFLMFVAKAGYYSTLFREVYIVLNRICLWSIYDSQVNYSRASHVKALFLKTAWKGLVIWNWTLFLMNHYRLL